MLPACLGYLPTSRPAPRSWRMAVSSIDPARCARLMVRTYGLIVGALSVLIAVLFARMNNSNYAEAKPQPLRAFQIVYILTIVFVGARIGRVTMRCHDRLSMCLLTWRS